MIPSKELKFRFKKTPAPLKPKSRNTQKRENFFCGGDSLALSIFCSWQWCAGRTFDKHKQLI